MNFFDKFIIKQLHCLALDSRAKVTRPIPSNDQYKLNVKKLHRLIVSFVIYVFVEIPPYVKDGKWIVCERIKKITVRYDKLLFCTFRLAMRIFVLLQNWIFPSYRSGLTIFKVKVSNFGFFYSPAKKKTCWIAGKEAKGKWIKFFFESFSTMLDSGK